MPSSPATIAQLAVTYAQLKLDSYIQQYGRKNPVEEGWDSDHQIDSWIAYRKAEIAADRLSSDLVEFTDIERPSQPLNAGEQDDGRKNLVDYQEIANRAKNDPTFRLNLLSALNQEIPLGEADLEGTPTIVSISAEVDFEGKPSTPDESVAEKTQSTSTGKSSMPDTPVDVDSQSFDKEETS